MKLEAKVSGRKLSAAFVESSLSKEFAASLRSSRCPFPSAHSCYETRVVVRKSNGERSRRGRKLVVDYGYSTVPVHAPLDARTLEIGGQWPLYSFFLSLNNSFGFSLKGQLTVRKTFFDDEKNNVFAPAAPTSSSDQKLSARLRVRNFHFPTPDNNETFLRIIEDYQATGHNDCKLVKPSFDRCLLRTKLRPTYLIPRFYLSLSLSLEIEWLKLNMPVNWRFAVIYSLSSFGLENFFHLYFSWKNFQQLSLKTLKFRRNRPHLLVQV